MIRTFFTCLFLFVALNIQAAEIDGKWKTSLNGPEGDIELIFIFNLTGNNLTGSIQKTGELNSNEITDGVINGNSFTFNISINGSIIKHYGKVLDDGTISIKTENSGEGHGLILTAVK